MKDIDFMKEALAEARIAFKEDEVPVGACLVLDNHILASAHNQTRTLKDPTAHAEILVLQKGSQHLSNERLLNATLYVTVEPCPMCAGALLWARVQRLVYGAKDEKAGACGSVVDLTGNSKFNHKIEVCQGILEQESIGLIQNFFRSKRNRD